MRWRWLGLTLVAALAASFLLVNRSQLPAALQAAQGANPLFLGAAAAVGMLYLLNYAAMYRAAYRAVGLTIPLGVAFRTANAAHVLNMTIVNSGGLAGLAPFLSDAKARGQGRGQVVSAYLLVTFLGHLVFALVLAVVLLLAARHGKVGRLEVLATSVFAAYTLFSVALLIAAARSRSALRWLHARPQAVRAWALGRIGRRAAAGDTSNEAADELYEALRTMLRRPRAMALPALHAFLVEVAGVATLWFCLKAFGVNAGLEAPFVAYAFGVLFGIVGFLPAGAGFAEAGLGLALASYGIDGVIIALAVVTYRLFEVWVPFAAGALSLLGLWGQPGEAEAR